MTRKKIAIVAGMVVGILTIAGATFAYRYINNDPERILYSALAEETPQEQYTTEKSTGNNKYRAYSDSYFNRDGTSKFSGKLVCEGSSKDYGDTNMTLSFISIGQSLYYKIDELTSSSSGDTQIDAENTSWFNTLTGQWVLLSDEDAILAGYKDDGVLFSEIGALSKDMSEQKIADLMKEENVINITSTKNTKYKGRAALEYHLEIRRSAYSRFMDRVNSDFEHKDEVLDELFTDDTQEITVLIDKAERRIIQQEYSIPNLCSNFLYMVDEDAAAEVPSHMEIKSVEGESKDVKKIKKPSEYLTSDEFNTLLYGNDAATAEQ